MLQLCCLNSFSLHQFGYNCFSFILWLVYNVNACIVAVCTFALFSTKGNGCSHEKKKVHFSSLWTQHFWFIKIYSRKELRRNYENALLVFFCSKTWQYCWTNGNCSMHRYSFVRVLPKMWRFFFLHKLF